MTKTDLSGLSDSTQYFFLINNSEYSITTGTSTTYEDVNNLLNSSINPSGFKSVIVGTTPNEDIRVIDDLRRGSESEVIMDNGVSGLDLFTNLNGFTSLEEPVSGGGKVEDISFVKFMEGAVSINAINSLDYVEVIYTTLISSMSISGNNDIDEILIIEETGGITVSSGGAIIHLVYENIGSGGITTGGVIPADFIGVIETGSGKLITSGTTIVDSIDITETTSGGTIINGASAYSIEIARISSGDMTISGSIIVDSIDITETTSGGILTSGSTLVDSIDIIETTSGGILTGGSTLVDSIDITETTSGGMTTDGIATTSYTTA